MNSKSLAVLLMIFGLLFALAQCQRFAMRDQDDSGDNDDSYEQEKRAILNFLQNGENANEFLDQSRRLFSDQKSQMKEAKKKYEEKCERTFHPRYCPDLSTWDAWNQAYDSATGKK